MFKVGDEVLVKAKIICADEDDTSLPYRVDVSGCETWIEGEEIVDADHIRTRGLTDAWELARKVFHTEALGGMSTDEMKKVFNTSLPMVVLENFTAEEALAKIEAYEKEKEIKVGDELVYGEGCLKTTFIVTFVDKNRIEGIEKSGHPCSFSLPNKYFEKTNKHIEIESLLKQIGE